MNIIPTTIEVKLFNKELLKKLKIISEEDLENSKIDLCYATEGALAFDLYAVIENEIIIGPKEQFLCPTGISINAYNDEYDFGIILAPRSGLGNRGLVLGNTIGIIDADYQGQILCSLLNRTHTASFSIIPGERIAQAMFIPKIQMKSGIIVDKFSIFSNRGSKGFGDSGRF